MAVTPTTRLALNKQDAGDANWHTALNAGFDNAEARFLLSGAASPVGVAQCHYIAQMYMQTGTSPPRMWIGTAIGSPGTWAALSQLSTGELAVAGIIALNNTIALQGKEAGGTARNIAQVTAADKVLLGSLTNLLTLQVSTVTGLKVEHGAGEQTIWHAGNDGNASGLDADTVKGKAPLGAGNTVGYFESSDQTITFSSDLSVAHGLGAAPKLVQLLLKCTIAEFNWSIGDVIQMGHGTDWFDGNNSGHGGSLVYADATNVHVITQSFLCILNKTGFDGNNSITAANWRYVVRAWV